MRTTIDAAGRVVIPKEIRRKAGLKAGTELEVCFAEEHVELEAVQPTINLVRKGHLLVAVGEGDEEPLTNDLVNQIREDIYRERAERIMGKDD